MASNRFYVYLLVDPINNLPFYVGKGSGIRAWDHTSGRDVHNKEKVRVIELIRMIGLEPKVCIFSERFEEQFAYDLEEHVILSCRKCGIPLTNIGSRRQPPSRKGSKWSKESLDKRKQTILSRPKKIYTIEEREQRRKQSTGLKHTAEQNQKQSDRMKKEWAENPDKMGRWVHQNAKDSISK